MVSAKEVAKPSPTMDSQFPVPNVRLGGEGMVRGWEQGHSPELRLGPSMPGWAEGAASGWLPTELRTPSARGPAPAPSCHSHACAQG